MTSADGSYKAILHIHTDRSAHWRYNPLDRFMIPDCYVPFKRRVMDYADSEINAMFITDHDVPFVMDEADYRWTSEYLQRRGSALEIGSGEEVTVSCPSAPGMPQGGGMDVLIIYRGLHPYFNRGKILARHEELHRVTDDIFEFFRFVKNRDDLIDIVAHPFAGPLRIEGEIYHRLLTEGLISRVEAFCGGEATWEQNLFACRLALMYNLGMTASDDKHSRKGRLRNYTHSPARNLDEFLNHLHQGQTMITMSHKPVYRRKLYEVLEGFYGGYLFWAAKNFPVHWRRDTPGILAQRVAFSIAAVPFFGLVASVGIASYLRRGSAQSRRAFAKLAALDPRLAQTDLQPLATADDVSDQQKPEF